MPLISQFTLLSAHRIVGGVSPIDFIVGPVQIDTSASQFSSSNGLQFHFDGLVGDIDLGCTLKITRNEDNSEDFEIVMKITAINSVNMLRLELSITQPTQLTAMSGGGFALASTYQLQNVSMAPGAVHTFIAKVHIPASV